MTQSNFSLGRSVLRGVNLAREVLSDLPHAMKQEHSYRTCRRKSAILALTWRCTCHCNSCTSWRRPDQRDAELTIDQWLQIGQKLLDQGIRNVEFFGGDVLLRKDLVYTLAEFLHKNGCDVCMATNCNLIDAPTAQRLAGYLHALALSTDGLDQTHDVLRGSSGNSSRVRRALEMVLAARGAQTDPELICNMTISRGNVDQIASLARLARQAGYDRIALEYVGQFEPAHVDRSHIGDEVPSPLFIRQGPSLLVEPGQLPLLREQVSRARELDGTRNGMGRPFRVESSPFDILSDKDLVEGTVPAGRCFMERTLVVMDPYGHVVPCLFFDNFAVSNALQDPPDKWTSNTRWNLFRNAHDCGKLELCLHCSMSLVRTGGWELLRRSALKGWQRPLDVSLSEDEQ